MVKKRSESSIMNTEEVGVDDKLSKVGDLYAELASEIFRIVGPEEEQLLFYAEAGDMWTGFSLYRNEAARVSYVDETVEDTNLLSDIVLDIWYAEDSDKRWVEMQLAVDGKKFEARQFYADQLDRRETYDDRRERAVRERFGDKPIYYSPLAMD